MVTEHVPRRGEIVWITLDPRVGHEQGGRRPAIVLSGSLYNGRVGLAVCCPITSRAKGYPFEVRLPDGLPVGGVVLVDQVRSIDWRGRKLAAMCEAPVSLVNEVLSTLDDLLERP